jgi:hypothetical protein
MADIAVIEYVETPNARGVQELSDLQADQLGVNKRNRYGLVLDCRCCGTSWSNTPDIDGELPRDFWVCPLRCNV